MQRRGDWQGSIDRLRPHLDSDPTDAEAQYMYGAALVNTGQISEAVWPLRRAQEDPKWQDRASLDLASIAVLTADWDTANSLLEPLLESDLDNLQARLLRAFARAQSRRDYEGTLDDVDAVLEQDPDSSDALVLRGVALLGLDRIDEAKIAIDAAAEHFDEAGLGLAGSPSFCATRATFAKEANELDEAERIFEDCLERFPIHFAVIDEAVKFFDQRGRSDRSIEILRTACEGFPAARNYRMSLVYRLSIAGKHDEAEEILVERTRVTDPYLAANAYSDLGSYYFERQRTEDAVAAFDAALALVPDPGQRFMFTYADVLIAGGRYDDAMTVAATLEPPSHRELIRGRVAFERGDPESALDHFTEGIRAWPANPIARYFAARTAVQLGLYDRAIEEYRYAIRADASATDARFRLARLYHALGDAATALEVIQHDIVREPSESIDRTLLEVELRAELGEPAMFPQAVLDQLRTPGLRARALAARSAGMRTRRGPQAAVETVLRANDNVDLGDPQNAAALESLVSDLIVLDRGTEALEHVDRAIAEHGGHASHHAIRGLVLMSAPVDADRARAEWEKALALDPRSALALRGLGGLARQAGEHETAIALYARAAAADEHDIEALRAQAAVLREAGRPGEAPALLTELLDRDPFAGADAIVLARLLYDDESTRSDPRIGGLLHCASRFGGGPEADALLETWRTERANAAERAAS